MDLVILSSQADSPDIEMTDVWRTVRRAPSQVHVHHGKKLILTTLFSSLNTSHSSD